MRCCSTKATKLGIRPADINTFKLWLSYMNCSREFITLSCMDLAKGVVRTFTNTAHPPDSRSLNLKSNILFKQMNFTLCFKRNKLTNAYDFFHTKVTQTYPVQCTFIKQNRRQNLKRCEWKLKREIKACKEI